MCRNFFLEGIKNRKIGKDGFSLIAHLIQNAYLEGNKDGYFIVLYLYGKGNFSLRTLSWENFISTLYQQAEAIERASKVHIHLRKATCAISQKNIHGWIFDSFRCSHNGVIFDLEKEDTTDSFRFFRKIKSFSLDSIQKTTEEELTEGWGIFIATNPHLTYFWTSEKAYLYLFGNFLLGVSSDSIVKPARTGKIEINLSIRKKRKLGFLTFERTEKQRKEFELPPFPERKVYQYILNSELISFREGIPIEKRDLRIERVTQASTGSLPWVSKGAWWRREKQWF
jgi:5'(3')-deoxyribonucleotidase